MSGVIVAFTCWVVSVRVSSKSMVSGWGFVAFKGVRFL